jgi:hypothetical protein
VATPVSAKPKPKPAGPIGTSFKFTLSAAARLQIVITESTSGLLGSHGCVAATTKLKGAHPKRCTRWIRVATITKTSEPKGADSVAFSGRIGRYALAPGAYRATLTATNSAGKSKPVTVTFTVVP